MKLFQKKQTVLSPVVVEKGGDVALIKNDSQTIMGLVEKAMSTPDFSVEKLQALLKVRDEWERREAEKAYTVAMNNFKKDPPEILKSKNVNFTTERGGTTNYNYAPLNEVVEAIGERLSACGLSHRWETSQGERSIRVSCVITHVLGHSESVTLESPSDTSGNKNAIQAIGSTVTYLERYTLLAATGCAVRDQDDDGQSAGQQSESRSQARPAPSAKNNGNGKYKPGAIDLTKPMPWGKQYKDVPFDRIPVDYLLWLGTEAMNVTNKEEILVYTNNRAEAAIKFAMSKLPNLTSDGLTDILVENCSGKISVDELTTDEKVGLVGYLKTMIENKAKK